MEKKKMEVGILRKALSFQGKDKQGRKVLLVIGKFFPARSVSMEDLKAYLEEKIFPKLENTPFCIVYIHTLVQKSENFPGISALRTLYEGIPTSIRDNLGAVYFVHAGLQSRVFFATCGRFMFSGGLYGKFKYINRLEFLHEHIRKNEIVIPEFVYDHDEDLENRPLMDYGLEMDHHRPVFEDDGICISSNASMHALRCES